MKETEKRRSAPPLDSGKTSSRESGSIAAWSLRNSKPNKGVSSPQFRRSRASGSSHTHNRRANRNMAREGGSGGSCEQPKPKRKGAFFSVYADAPRTTPPCPRFHGKICFGGIRQTDCRKFWCKGSKEPKKKGGGRYSPYVYMSFLG